MISVEPILNLRDLVPDGAALRFEAVPTFADLRGRLRTDCPGLYEGVFNGDGTLRDSVLLFVNQVNVGSDADAIRLSDGDTIALVPAIVGG